jgi:hypothetical protein
MIGSENINGFQTFTDQYIRSSGSVVGQMSDFNSNQRYILLHSSDAWETDNLRIPQMSSFEQLNDERRLGAGTSQTFDILSPTPANTSPFSNSADCRSWNE